MKTIQSIQVINNLIKVMDQGKFDGLTTRDMAEILEVRGSGISLIVELQEEDGDVPDDSE